jgi:hypothetical protein
MNNPYILEQPCLERLTLIFNGMFLSKFREEERHMDFFTRIEMNNEINPLNIEYQGLREEISNIPILNNDINE